jgi:CheY-like chemotaxis protein
MIGSASGLRPVELLLVEDSASDIFIIKDTLRELPFPINVRIAVDGQQALKMFADENVRPDLVILDLNLPKVHGFELLQRCNLPEMRIVVFSSSSKS